MTMPNLAAALLLSACTAAQDPGPTARVAVDHTPLDAILAANVRDERVDYLAIRDHHARQLRDYLRALGAVDPASLPETERLAFYINLYNASMIAAVIDRLRADYSTAADDYRVFKKDETVLLQGEMVTLDHIEHDIVRKQFAEPRIHVALVCGARSCPPLLARAYRGADLDAVLARNMRRFVNDETRNVVDTAAKRLRLSQLFNWFAADFGGERGVRRLVGSQAGVDVTGYQITYLEYSWALNIAAPEDGRIVAAKRQLSLSSTPESDDVLATVEPGTLLHAVGELRGAVEVVVPGNGEQRGYVAKKDLSD